ncbi:hypothetical protein BN940_05906 [Castellaniella defragrans 65Phen]|uniref:Uncharacterized protein n=1 Tax=Castellaniella defragrans (strain DSM 12143 / CCUG 39792 / 65Phen) TaxID=1437824 RepID=W8X8T8_CASD6|nr:hypothetical protein BN940_05906 [Castellaniella defragrans 65Phen]
MNHAIFIMIFLHEPDSDPGRRPKANRATIQVCGLDRGAG